MQQTDFRDVPDELWERIEPLLVPFKRKRSGGKIHLHVGDQGISLGVTTTGATGHDSRLRETPLKNSRKMGSWFVEAEVRHLCLDKGYDYPRVSEEVHVNEFEKPIRSRGKKSVNAGGILSTVG